MEEADIQTLKDFVCEDAWKAIPLAYRDLMKTFDSDYQLYQDSENEKLEWIDSTLREMRENLVESPFKASFALDVMNDNLFTTFKNFCDAWPINGRAFGINKYMSVTDYEKAVLVGEIRSLNAPMTREEAIAKLKESKDLLDLGLLEPSDYEKIKQELTPIIMKK